MIQMEIPGVPVPKGRPRLGRYCTYTPQKTKDYEDKIRMSARRVMSHYPGIILEGALEVIVTVILPVPGSYSKTRRERCLAGLDRPIVRPDLDNYLKCLDALNGIVWKDDSQVVTITAQKKYGEEPRMIVTVLKKGE